MSRYWLNIFDTCDVTEVHNEHYIIRYNKESNSCDLYDKFENIIPQRNVKNIIDKYNIFDGLNIITDRESFTTNGITRITDITNFITNYYRISWVKKILCKKDLASGDLERFVESCRCHVVDLQKIENTYNLVVRDNFDDTYYLSVLFHDRSWCKSEPYYSKFSIAKPNFALIENTY